METIVVNDEVLRIEHLENRDVLYIGEIGFGINTHGENLSLLSSTMMEDPKVQRQVVDYLNNCYGTPEECKPYNYRWYIGKSDEDNYIWIVWSLVCDVCILKKAARTCFLLGNNPEDFILTLTADE